MNGLCVTRALARTHYNRALLARHGGKTCTVKREDTHVKDVDAANRATMKHLVMVGACYLDTILR